MLKVRKGNRVLKIPDEKMYAYKADGYTIATMDGKLLYEPNNPQKELEKARAENATLAAENERLKKLLEEAKGSGLTSGKTSNAADKAPGTSRKAARSTAEKK